jgi:hypothetical protein
MTGMSRCNRFVPRLVCAVPCLYWVEIHSLIRLIRLIHMFLRPFLGLLSSCFDRLTTGMVCRIR